MPAPWWWSEPTANFARGNHPGTPSVLLTRNSFLACRGLVVGLLTSACRHKPPVIELSIRRTKPEQCTRNLASARFRHLIAYPHQSQPQARSISDIRYPISAATTRRLMHNIQEIHDAGALVGFSESPTAKPHFTTTTIWTEYSQRLCLSLLNIEASVSNGSIARPILPWYPSPKSRSQVRPTSMTRAASRPCILTMFHASLS